MINSKNTGSFYKYVNSKTTTQGNINILIDDNGTIISDNDGKAELLNSYFGSIISGATPNTARASNISKRVPNHTSIDSIDFTPTKLIATSKKIKAKKTTDPDGYSNILLKQVIPYLAYPLSLMYNSFFFHQPDSSVPLSHRYIKKDRHPIQQTTALYRSPVSSAN